MESGAGQLIALVLQPANLAVVMGVWIVLDAFRRMLPAAAAAGWYARALPILPLVLAVAAMWLPGVAQASMSVGDKVLLGLMLGFASAHATKILKQTGMGKDDRINPPEEILK